MGYISSNISNYLIINKIKNISIEYPIESEEEIHMIMVLRDKIYSIFIELISQLIAKISFNKIVTSKEELLLKRITKKIMNHYLNEIFKEITKSIELDINKKGLILNKKYKKIGTLIKEIKMIEKLNKIPNKKEENT